MKKLTSLLLIFFIHGFFFHTALAQDGKTALVPLPSVDDFTRGKDGWSFGLGVGLNTNPPTKGRTSLGSSSSRLVQSSGVKAVMFSIGRVNH